MKNPAGQKPRMISLPVDVISPNPNQPRRIFSDEDTAALTESIRVNGLLQPLTVRHSPGGGYELIAGERRLRACKLCGIRNVDCILYEKSDEESSVLSLVENIVRADLNFFEEAEAISRLTEVYGMRQEEIASRLSRKQSTVANKLRLLRLSAAERAMILSRGLSERHARALIRIENSEQRMRALSYIASHGMKAEAAERYIDRIVEPAPSRRGIPLVRDIRIVMNTLNRALDTIVTAGIPAVASHEDLDDCIIYTVRIPKAV